MSEAFAFPAAPTLNQIVTLPNGAKAQWNGTDWVSLDATGTYVLKTGDTMTGPLAHASGTVAAPGVAWASESGLGWYRSGAGTVDFASNGNQVERLYAASSSLTYRELLPRAAGSAEFILYNAPYNAVAGNSLTLGVNAQSQYINGQSLGEATPKPLTLGGFPAVQINGPAGRSATLILSKTSMTQNAYLQGGYNSLTRWGIALGNSVPEGSANAGSDFSIVRYDDAGAALDTAMYIKRSSGVISTPGVPAFKASCSASVAAGAVVVFNLVSFNTGNYYNSANGRFTAPVTGRYRFSWQHLLSNTPAGEYRISLRQNASTVLTTILYHPGTGFQTIATSANIFLNAGDYVDCHHQSGPASLYLDQTYNAFSGELIG